MLENVEWSLPAVLDAVTETAPDRDMLVFGADRRAYRYVQDRTRRLGAYFVQHGLGVQQERAQLQRWECGQSRVAILLSNCPEYAEAMIGAFRARAVPYNVNYQYNPREVAALLRQIGVDAVVYHRRFGRLLAESDLDGLVLLDVDDGSGVAPLEGSIPFEAAIASGIGRRCPARTLARRRLSSSVRAAPPAGRKAWCGGKPTSTCPGWAARTRRHPRSSHRSRPSVPACGSPRRQ